MKRLISQFVVALIIPTTLAACNLQNRDSSSVTTSPTSPEASNVLEVTPVDLLTEFVLEADLIVSGTISDAKYEEVGVGLGGNPGRFVYTIFTLTVDKVIKGDPDTKEAFIKLPGGKYSDGVSVMIPGALYFSVPENLLIGLNKTDDNYYGVIPNGIFWVKNSSLNINEILGRIILIMKRNQMPIALPETEFPPLSMQVSVDGTSIGLNKNANIYVYNRDNGLVSVYNLGSFKLISRIFVGRDGKLVAPTEKPKLFVISGNTTTLSVINMDTNSLEKQIVIKDTPEDIAYIPDSGDILLTLPRLKQIQLLKAPLFNVERTFTLEYFPDRLGVSSDGKTIYVTAGSEPDEPMDILIAIDLKTGNKRGEIKIVKDWHDLAFSKRGNKLYISNQSSNSISQVNLLPLGIDKTFTDITKRQSPDSSIGSIVTSADDKFLYFSDSGTNNIRDINLKTGLVEKEISSQYSTPRILLSGSGNYLLSTSGGGIGIESGVKSPGVVTIINLKSWKIICRIWVEHGASQVVENHSL